MVVQEKEESCGWAEALGEHASNPTAPKTVGHEIQAGGVTWIVSNLENRIRAQFEQWVRAGAEHAFSTQGNPEVQRHMINLYVESRAARHYDWEESTPHSEAGSAIRAAVADLPGMTYLFYLLLKRCHPGVTLKTARKILNECPQAIVATRWALGNSEAPQEGAANRNGTPKTQEPTTFDAA
jgi:hypothetical protein